MDVEYKIRGKNPHLYHMKTADTVTHGIGYHSWEHKAITSMEQYTTRKASTNNVRGGFIRRVYLHVFTDRHRRTLAVYNKQINNILNIKFENISNDMFRNSYEIKLLESKRKRFSQSKNITKHLKWQQRFGIWLHR